MRLKFKDGNGGAPELQRTPPDTPAVKVTGKARCGHEADKLGPPQFRKAMLANIAERDCPACRKARQEAERAAAVARRSDPSWIAEQEAKKQRKKVARYEKKLSRLPCGSRFDATYDATSTSWTGTLAIGSHVFRATCSGVFGLLRKLDHAWRRALENSTPATPLATDSASSSEIEGSGGGFRTRQEYHDDPPPLENHTPAEDPQEPSRTTTVANHATATCERKDD